MFVWKVRVLLARFQRHLQIPILRYRGLKYLVIKMEIIDNRRKEVKDLERDVQYRENVFDAGAVSASACDRSSVKYAVANVKVWGCLTWR